MTKRLQMGNAGVDSKTTTSLAGWCMKNALTSENKRTKGGKSRKRSVYISTKKTNSETTVHLSTAQYSYHNLTIK